MKSTCQWIDGDPLEPGWEFCGQPTMERDVPWCRAHYVRVYQVEGYVAETVEEQRQAA